MQRAELRLIIFFVAARRKSLGRLFVVGIALLVLIWAGFNAANFALYRRLYVFAQESAGENLAVLAKSIASQLPLEWVEALVLGMPEISDQDPAPQLVSLVDNRRLYTIAVLDTSGLVLFSTDPQLEVGEANPYWASDVGALRAAALGVPSYGGLHRVGDRFMRVAFAPITDPLGDVVAVVGVEAGAQYFRLLGAAWRGLWLSGIVSAAAIVFVVALLWIGKRELERLERHLEQAATLSGIGMMAATLAHEVRNPLAIIRSSAEAIPLAEGDEVTELVQFITEEVDRLAGIVESHLAVARGREFPKTPQRLSVVVDKVVPRYQEQLSQRGVGLIVEIEDDPVVPYSFSGMRQVLYNLLNNAASATKPGGTIRIRISTSHVDGVECATLSVSDTGVGIPKDMLEAIFEPFHTTKSQGTGLGLFITKKIVEGHGGKIWVESEEGVGTKFTVAIPK